MRRRSAARAVPVFTLCLCASVVFSGCSQGESAAPAWAATDTAPARNLELVVFVYDRSTSIPGYQLDLARRLTNERVRRLHYGDRVAATQVLQISLAEPPRRWSQTVPLRQWKDQRISRDSIARQRFLKDTQDYLVEFTDTLGRGGINGTDILSTLHDVAEELHGSPGRRTTLYIFSDMLQSNRTIDMEGLRKMPPPDWIRKRKAEGRLPDLSGLCVMAIGPRVDTGAAQRVKRFWSEYFEATGATLLDRNYTLRPVTLPVHPCEEDSEAAPAES